MPFSAGARLGPYDQLLRITVELAEALDKAHGQGFSHRDLKPGNLMLTKAGSKLLDFGLAKPISAGGSMGSGLASLPTQGLSALTAQGTVLGTFQYMSPEQLQGKDAGARSDIFAFGKIEHGLPRPVFDARPARFGARTHRFAATADGQRFLIITPVEAAESAPITVVVNWQAARKN